MTRGRDYVERRRKDLEQEQSKGGWWQHWQDLSQYILPGHGRFVRSTTSANKGDKVHGSIIDNAAGYAAEVLAAGMQAGLSSPARPWFRLTLADQDIARFSPVRQWLDEIQRRMAYIFSKSNLYHVLHGMYQEMGVFATATMGVYEDYNSIIYCRPYTVGEYTLGASTERRVDTLYRSFHMNTEQLIKEFGEENVSSSVRAAYRNGDKDRWWPCVHLIEPNDDRKFGMEDAKNKPWRSVYYEEGHDQFARVSGFNEFPILAARWQTVGTNIYGSNSPGMNALADVKALQKESEKFILAVEKSVDPPLKAASSLRNTRITGVPGGVTYYDEAEGGTLLSSLYDVNPNFAAMSAEMNSVRQRIDKFFFVDLFKMFTALPGRQITATEVAERHEEKLLMIGQVVERVQSEVFDNLIERTFNIMGRHEGLIPVAPAEIQGMDLQIEYIGVLAQAQKMVRTASIQDATRYAMELAQAKPDVLDNVDFDAAVSDYIDAVGAPARMSVPEHIVKRSRRERQAAQQQANNMAVALQAIEGAKKLSDTDVEEPSALKVLTSGTM